MWHPESWQQHPIVQQPEWPDQASLAATLKRLSTLPPLVFAEEIELLKTRLAEASRGEAFLLQGGDCAEDFSACTATNIRETLKVILQMAVVLSFAGNRRVVKVGRIAGQYAKPRSSPTENIKGLVLPSYRGDCVNRPEPTLAARTPDPQRLMEAYFHSTATLNLLRAYVHGGYADLHKVHIWNKEFVAHSSQGRRYEALAADIDRALSFMQTCGIHGDRVPQIREAEFFTSHEALILGYEQSLTRRDSLSGRWYDCSAHMLWIGDRTRQLDGAHVEFFRGVHNPIGIKVGPSSKPDELLRILDKLNPENRPGRITLICRFGADKVDAHLPAILQAVHSAGRSVLWSCDPMHGNTFTAPSGYKTRDFASIIAEVTRFFHLHGEAGTIPGGIHFELTGNDVTEVCGGAQNIQDHDLKSRYLTSCDPRLNCQQALEISFQIAELLRGTR